MSRFPSCPPSHQTAISLGPPGSAAHKLSNPPVYSLRASTTLLAGTARAPTDATVEVNDALFCEHGLEVCKTCEFDGREGESRSALSHTSRNQSPSSWLSGAHLPTLHGVCRRMQDRVLAHTADNDAMMGLDPKPRGPLEMPAYYKNTKDGQIMCKAHANSNCKSCCEWRVAYPPKAPLSLYATTRHRRPALHICPIVPVHCPKCTALTPVGWKKMIVKLQKEGSKAAKKAPKNTSNF